MTTTLRFTVLLLCAAFCGCQHVKQPTKLRSVDDLIPPPANVKPLPKFSRAAAIPAIPLPATLAFQWNYGIQSNIVFRVYSWTNLTGARKLAGVTTNKQFIAPIDKPFEFFSVTASNTQTHMESGYSTK